jgi:biopolymer transport protein ExbD
MNFRRKEVEELDVNITPLIDVVFLLLIFFMVSTTFDHQSELSIDLPQASGKISETQNKILDIAIDASGEYYLNSKKMSDAKIETLIKEIKLAISKVKEPKIIISADKNTPHQAVMSVMDAARRLNITHLTFAAVKPD